jgi:23S rRNA maturation-related 3'-5' exoribonuclease YhaM
MAFEKTLAKHPTRLHLKTLCLFAVVNHKKSLDRAKLALLPNELKEEIAHIEASIQNAIHEQHLKEMGQNYRNKFDLCC